MPFELLRHSLLISFFKKSVDNFEIAQITLILVWSAVSPFNTNFFVAFQIVKIGKRGEKNPFLEFQSVCQTFSAVYTFCVHIFIRLKQ